MTQNIAQQLEQSYARASLRDTAKHLRNPQDWQQVRDIQVRSNQARQTERENYQQDYPARLADAREAILNERAAWHYTHPAPQSAARQDRFNKDQIERQAHLRVHNAHHRTMAKIDAHESRDLKQLMQQNQSPTSVPHFSQASDNPHHQVRRER
ncbi:hypothetical protein [Tateyamaria sp.]|uniref:hypothetical protein n=1 Tax=Tateyamaria sp. TaxID=1929288 RepID=UPI00329BAABE